MVGLLYFTPLIKCSLKSVRPPSFSSKMVVKGPVHKSFSYHSKLVYSPFGIALFYVLYSKLLHRPPLKIDYVIEDCMGLNLGLLQNLPLQSDTLNTRLDLIHSIQSSLGWWSRILKLFDVKGQVSREDNVSFYKLIRNRAYFLWEVKERFLLISDSMKNLIS